MNWVFFGNITLLILIISFLFSETNVKKATTNVSATSATAKMTTNNNSSTIMKGKKNKIVELTSLMHIFARNTQLDKRRRSHFELLSLSVVFADEFYKKWTLIILNEILYLCSQFEFWILKSKLSNKISKKNPMTVMQWK